MAGVVLILKVFLFTITVLITGGLSFSICYRMFVFMIVCFFSISLDFFCHPVFNESLYFTVEIFFSVAFSPLALLFPQL